MSALVVVTGASRGVGRAAALAFGRRGLSLALVGRPSERLEEATAAVRALGVDAASFGCDVASEPEVARAAELVLERFGAPSVVVNNAGVVHRGTRIAETRSEDFDRVLAVNLRGPFLVSRAFLPAMLARKQGRFVFVASISATIGSPGAASYAASKWGLVGLMKSLAEELRGTGLTAMALSPGSVDTDMLVGSGFAPAMTADEVGEAIADLALRASDAMNGTAVEMFG